MNHFDAAYLTAAPVFLASAWYKRLRHGKYRRSLPGMFGANLPNIPLPAMKERLWLHSVSVGETVAAGALFRALRSRNPEWEFLSTTTTETGQDQARRSLAEANHHDFMPVDLSWVVRRFLDAYRPSVYTFLETEIWPNVLLQCGQRNMPVFMVNGKLSERSARGYARLRPLLAGPLGSVTAFLMQTEADAERMRRIAGPRAAIHVTGNVKFDNLPSPMTQPEREELRASLGVAPERLLFVVGSTHPTEEKLALDAYRQYQRDSGPPATLAIVPRHPERFDEVARELERLGAAVHRLSTNQPPPGAENVLLVDRMGMLGRLFGAADIALLGGAWNPIGGHNLLEPLAHGVPVIHGPHMHEQKEIMRILKGRGATIPAHGAAKVAEALLELARSPQRRIDMGMRGQAAARENQGAAGRAADLMMDLLARR